MAGLLDTLTGLLGYLAGHSYRVVERLAGQASLFLLVLAVLIAAVVLVARWVARHPERVQAFADRQLSRPRVARLRAGQLAFLVRWLHPALGLSLTLTLLVLLAAGWAFAAVLEDVVARNELAIWDQPVAGFVLAHREPWLTTVMRAVTELGSPTVLAPLIAVIGLAWWRRTGSWRPLALLTAAGLGAWLLAGGIKLLIDRQRPPAATDLAGHLTGYAFPSGHATTAMAVYGMLAALLAAATPRWGRKVTAWAAALILALLVAASRVYLGAHWLTDVLGGLALGATWLFALLGLTRLYQPLLDRRRLRNERTTSPG
ncbi:hypothetical protein C3Y87_01000 [Carbonactinospora thermoautotrophica]|uniref:phosphatase PAP2 family protein n=1 Tax=Carbonactinospora thermoautotrophica TaxID=1469144 RepID=UPI002270B26C|nr:phosphatase PAP2 family protein [Carbonactinospora thermoautotrophica]MCX9190014.1 hypothetical protein [Carbonactinospora thermoautotrophica]